MESSKNNISYGIVAREEFNSINSVEDLFSNRVVEVLLTDKSITFWEKDKKIRWVIFIFKRIVEETPELKVKYKLAIKAFKKFFLENNIELLVEEKEVLSEFIYRFIYLGNSKMDKFRYACKFGDDEYNWEPLYLNYFFKDIISSLRSFWFGIWEENLKEVRTQDLTDYIRNKFLLISGSLEELIYKNHENNKNLQEWDKIHIDNIKEYWKTIIFWDYIVVSPKEWVNIIYILKKSENSDKIYNCILCEYDIKKVKTQECLNAFYPGIYILILKERFRQDYLWVYFIHDDIDSTTGENGYLNRKLEVKKDNSYENIGVTDIIRLLNTDLIIKEIIYHLSLIRIEIFNLWTNKEIDETFKTRYKKTKRIKKYEWTQLYNIWKIQEIDEGSLYYQILASYLSTDRLQEYIKKKFSKELIQIVDDNGKEYEEEIYPKNYFEPRKVIIREK